MHMDILYITVAVCVGVIVLGITQPTMKKLLYSGEIVGFKVGVNWRIRKEKLLEYIEAGETEVKEARKA